MAFNGWLAVYKNKGISSNHLLGRVKRLLQVKKAGFVGTLDPAAEGVLAIALGQATKTIRYIKKDSKIYQFDIVFGIHTQSFDLESEVIARSSTMPTLLQIKQELKQNFTGDIIQTPPTYSAIKINGQRAYKLARMNKKIEMPSRTVKINAIRLINFDQERHLATIMVECSSGTYVRSIGVELAKNLDSLAVVTNIKRLASTNFSIKHCITLDKLEKVVYNSGLKHFIMDSDFILDDIPVVELNQVQAQQIKNGKKISFSKVGIGQGLHRAKLGKNLVAVGNLDCNLFTPKTVFNN